MPKVYTTFQKILDPDHEFKQKPLYLFWRWIEYKINENWHFFNLMTIKWTSLHNQTKILPMHTYKVIGILLLGLRNRYRLMCLRSNHRQMEAITILWFCKFSSKFDRLPAIFSLFGKVASAALCTQTTSHSWGFYDPVSRPLCYQ